MGPNSRSVLQHGIPLHPLPPPIISPHTSSARHCTISFQLGLHLDRLSGLVLWVLSWLGCKQRKSFAFSDLLRGSGDCYICCSGAVLSTSSGPYRQRQGYGGMLFPWNREAFISLSFPPATAAFLGLSNPAVILLDSPECHNWLEASSLLQSAAVVWPLSFLLSSRCFKFMGIFLTGKLQVFSLKSFLQQPSPTSSDVRDFLIGLQETTQTLYRPLGRPSFPSSPSFCHFCVPSLHLTVSFLSVFVRKFLPST